MEQDELKAILLYSKKTGDFTWKERRGSRAAKGSVAGSEHRHRGKKYWRIRLNKKIYYAHRLAWLYVNGEFPELEIDHIDGNGLNNSWSNLREVTRTENNRNKRLCNNNTSGVTGVHWFKASKKWQAQIRYEGKSVHLGYFKYKEEAIKVRRQAEIDYGYHDNHGTDRPL